MTAAPAVSAASAAAAVAAAEHSDLVFSAVNNRMHST